MRNVVLFLIFVFLIAVAYLGYRIFYIEANSQFGWLKIDSTPTAIVFVDGVAVGKTPYEDRQKVGKFKLKLVPEMQGVSIVSWQGEAEIYKNAYTYVNRELMSSNKLSAGHILTIVKISEIKKTNDELGQVLGVMSQDKSNTGEIYVSSEPAGALVYLDNDEKGAVTPLILADVIQGEHEVSVASPGYFRRNIKINVEAGYRVNLEVKLALDESQAKPKVKEASTNIKLPIVTLRPDDKNNSSGTVEKVKIGQTGTGWLRVRSSPSLSGEVIGTVDTGQKYILLGEDYGWYKIKFEEGEGWISADYASKVIQ